jgi:hypothetical protein
VSRYLIVQVEDQATEHLAVGIALADGVEDVTEVPEGSFPEIVAEQR